MPAATKEQILDAAEQLIAERGIDGVSLRAITTAADVNLAAVHYHFGSKEGLVRTVFERRIRPVNDARLQMLAAAERAAGDGPVQVEAVLRALIEPAMRLYSEHERGPQFMQMCGRIYAEQSAAVQSELDDLFQDLIERFQAAFARALPELPQAELAWRIHFAAGAMIHTLMDSNRLKRFSRGLCDPGDTDAAVDRLVRFCAAGMRAAVSEGAAMAVDEPEFEAVQEAVQ